MIENDRKQKKMMEVIDDAFTSLEYWMMGHVSKNLSQR